MIATSKAICFQKTIFFFVLLFIASVFSSSLSKFPPPPPNGTPSYNVAKGGSVRVSLKNILPHHHFFQKKYHSKQPSFEGFSAPLSTHLNSTEDISATNINPSFSTDFNNPLSSKQHSKDLPSHPSCLFQVEEEDEWLRVGDVFPKVFSCQMKYLEYRHSGKPHPVQEVITLNVYETFPVVRHVHSIKLSFHITKPQKLIFLHEESTDTPNAPWQLAAGGVRHNPLNGHLCFIEASVGSDVTLKNPFKTSEHDRHPLAPSRTSQQPHQPSVHLHPNDSYQHDFHIHLNNLHAKDQIVEIFSCQMFGMLQLQAKHKDPSGFEVKAQVIKNDSHRSRFNERYYMQMPSHSQTSERLPPIISFKNKPPQLSMHSESKLHLPSNLFKLSHVTNNLILMTNLSKMSDVAYFTLENNRSKIINSFRYVDFVKGNIILKSRKPRKGLFEDVYIEFKAMDFSYKLSNPFVLKIKVTSKAQSHHQSISATVEFQRKSNIFKQLVADFANQTVTFRVTTAPLHGTLNFAETLLNKAMFSLQDVVHDRVTYTHNDPYSVVDEVVLVLEKPQKSSKLLVQISVLKPIDLASPLITQKKSFFIKNSSNQLQLSQFDAVISAVEAENDLIKFRLVSKLLHGGLVLKTHSMAEGVAVQWFSRYHLKHGLVYYDLKTPTQEINVEVLKLDVCSPFSKIKKKLSMELNIESFVVEETAFRSCGNEEESTFEVTSNTPVAITSRMLCWMPKDDATSDLTYYITIFPQLSNSSTLESGGKIVKGNSESSSSEHGEVTLKKAPQLHSITEIASFTQAMINQTSIFFMPPAKTLGQDRLIENITKRIAIFEYAVTYAGATLRNRLQFLLLPSNRSTHVFLHIGMTKTLSDTFTALELPPSQTLTLLANPHHGVLAKGGHVMKKGQSWTIAQFSFDNVWYQHKSGTCSRDVIVFSMGGAFYHLSIYALPHQKLPTKRFVLKKSQNDKQHLRFRQVKNDVDDEEDIRKSSRERNEKKNKKESFAELLKKSIVLVQPQHGRLVNEEAGVLRLIDGEIEYEPSKPTGPLASDGFVLYTNNTKGQARGVCQFSITNVTLVFPGADSNSLKLLIKKDLKVDGLEKVVIDHRVMRTLVNEGGTSSNNENYKNTSDVIYRVHQSPVWGRIIKDESHETIKYFSDQDLKNGVIHYQLGAMKGKKKLSKLTDSVLIYATQGSKKTPIKKLVINITTLKATIRKRSFRHSFKHNQQRHQNRKRYISKHHKPSSNYHKSSSNYHRRTFNVEKRRNSFGLKVRDIKVKRGGKHKFVVTFKKPSKKRRSMSETRLILEKPPSHGKLVVLNRALPKTLVNSFGSQDLQIIGDNFEKINLLDISNKVPMIYEHDGSRTKSDNFILTLSNDVKTIKQGVSVKVSSKAKVALRPEQLHTAPLLLHEDHPIVLSDVHLAVRDTYISPDDIEFELVKLPEHGYLKVLDQHIRPVNQEQVRLHETFSLTDVVTNKVLFVPFSASIVNDSFELQVNSDLPVLQFKVLSRNLLLKDYSLVLKTNDNSEACMDEKMLDKLKLEEQEMKCSQLSLTKPPKHGSLPRSVFSGEDMVRGELCYKGISHQSSFDHFELTFTSCNNKSEVLLNVEVVQEDPTEKNSSPKLLVNVPLMVMHGTSAPLTNSNLHASQPNVLPSQLVYSVSDQPKHGALLLDDQPCDKFSQSDLDHDRVVYKSNRIDDSMMDYFLFNVHNANSDDENTSNVKSLFFSILIQPAVKPTPKLIIQPSNSPIGATTDHKYFLPFNSSHLKLINVETPPEDIIYHIKVRPKHGRIENVVNGKFMRNRFSQLDLDKNHLRFFLKSRFRGQNDSITFKVNQSNKTVLDNHKVTFEWVVMEFQKASFKLCSFNHLFTLPITRAGKLHQATSARVDLFSDSFIEHVDFIKMSEPLVNFVPGQTRVEWSLKLLERGLLSHRRHFTTTLTNASDGVIGHRSKAYVEVVDKKDEYCSRRKIRKTSSAVLALDRSYGKKRRGYRGSGGKLGADNLLESDLAFYNERQRRKESSGEKMDEYSPNIPKPCGPSTESLLFYHQEVQQMFLCDGRRWVKWNNRLEDVERNLAKKLKRCPLGWEMYDDNCFLASKSKHSWLSGEKMCRREGGHLTFVASKEHLQWLSTLTRHLPFWTGLNNRRKSGSWETVGRHHSNSYIEWSPHQSCINCKYRCAQVDEEQEFKKMHCYRSHSRFVCVKAARLTRTSRKAVRQRLGRYNRRYKMT